jgi:predicted O-methyltransferase YrrM
MKPSPHPPDVPRDDAIAEVLPYLSTRHGRARRHRPGQRVEGRAADGAGHAEATELVSRIGRLTARIPPDATITNVAHRGLLGLSAPRLAGRRDRASRAIARALRTTALGRFSPGERAWIERIEARRRRMAAEYTLPGAERTAGGEIGAASHGRVPELWSPPFRWSMPRVWARFLMRLVGELGPRSCLELGTGFGISALYQGAALELLGNGTLNTLDREPSLIPIAERGFAELGLEERIALTRGPIGETLGVVAARQAPIHYALIDAEHTEEATVQNFDRLRPHLAPGAVAVVDDIFMTEEMRRAWATIAGRPCVDAHLTLRRLGIVVIDDPQRAP